MENNLNIDELLYWLHWTARQQPETVTEQIDLDNPLMEEVLINLN